jgi:uncharacterized protein
MSKKGDRFYFNNLVDSAELSREAAVMLKATLTNFDACKLDEQRVCLHEIEHRGDNNRHEIMHRLVTAFVTPIERDDLTKLSQNIDDVTDAIEDILIRIDMTNITEIRPDSIEFAELVIHCCNAMKEMLQEFTNFKKSKKLKNLIIEINRLEEVGDEKYVRCMKDLHTGCNDPITIIAWREIYDIFEKCCDSCENVADIVEGIVIGNS